MSSKSSLRLQVSEIEKQSGKMKKRFIVKKVKIVWRSNKIAGNPVIRSFTHFGVYDNNWQKDQYCRCPRPGGEFSTNNGQWQKYRIVIDDEAKAKRIASKMNELAEAIGGAACQIEFGVMKPTCIRALSTYISDEDVNSIVITKSSV